jgi:hypothetical protein
MIMLRRTFTPYVGLIVINVVTTLIVIFIAFKANDLGQLKWVLPFYGIWGIYILLATRYRVGWDQIGVTMLADWGKRTVEYREISSVRYETARVADGHYGTRPFRRIVVRGRRQTPKAFVDVSLRHFEPKDICALLDEISRQRPDLSIPWQPVCRYLSVQSPVAEDQPLKKKIRSIADTNSDGKKTDM